MLTSSSGAPLDPMPDSAIELLSRIPPDVLAHARAVTRRALGQYWSIAFYRFLEDLNLASLELARFFVNAAEMEAAVGCLLRRAIEADEREWVEQPTEDLVPVHSGYILKARYQQLLGLSLYNGGLTKALLETIAAWQAQREIAWELPAEWPSFQEMKSLADRVASGLVKGIESLVSSSSLLRDMERFEELTQRQAQSVRELPVRAFKDATLYRLATEGIARIECGLHRIGQILELLWPVTPSSPAQRFLLRVSKCYLAGFDAECAIMCRAVLDAEFKASVENDDCIDFLQKEQRRGKRKSQRGINFELRISTAEDQARISPQTAQWAHIVRETGNDAVHDRPEVAVDALGLIEKTLHVISELRAR